MVKLRNVFTSLRNICLFKELAFSNKFQFKCHQLFQKDINIPLL